jgi:hypothetical protein
MTPSSALVHTLKRMPAFSPPHQDSHRFRIPLLSVCTLANTNVKVHTRVCCVHYYLGRYLVAILSCPCFSLPSFSKVFLFLPALCCIKVSPQSCISLQTLISFQSLISPRSVSNNLTFKVHSPPGLFWLLFLERVTSESVSGLFREESSTLSTCSSYPCRVAP